MAVVIVLVGATLLLRGLGALGVDVFAEWVSAARGGLAAMLVFTGVCHFGRIGREMEGMIPQWVPWPRAMVWFTGMCELAGAAGLMIPSLRRAAGYALIAFFVAVFPANVRAAGKNVMIGGQRATPLWVRAPTQIVFIALAWWVSR